jgi:ATP phosphoribosyltransferase
MKNNQLVIALPKGRLGDDAIKKLNLVGYPNVIDPKSRKLIFEDDENELIYMFIKPIDVLTYVVNGIADIGIIGKDIIMEKKEDIYELIDLSFGKCTFAVAGFKFGSNKNKDELLKIATKYPNITKQYFSDKNQDIEIFELNGSVELGPIVGLSDVIVDIVETGSTLKANGLEVIENMYDISARLISNKASYRFKRTQIQTLVDRLKKEANNDSNHLSI